MVLKNILIGEVWLCSGQSNMEMHFGGWGKVQNYKEEIDNVNYPEIRLLQAEHNQSQKSITNFKVQQAKIEGNSIKVFSSKVKMLSL